MGSSTTEATKMGVSFNGRIADSKPADKGSIPFAPANHKYNYMAIIIEAPNVFGIAIDRFSIFLAGSIANGTAVNWQDKLSKNLSNLDIVILNPRRKNWNPDADKTLIRKQITWEQEAIHISNIVIFYFDPSKQSPISLLELGQCLGSGKKVIVYCPPSYFRFDNIEVTCARYNLKPHSDYQLFLTDIVCAISRL